MNSNVAPELKRQWLFVLARVYLGVSFLFSDHGNRQPNELAGFLKFAMKNGYSWYRSFLNAMVLPHAATFGTLIVVAEVYVGIALVLGLTTRLAALVALFLLFNYMCAICAQRASFRGDRGSINRISFLRSLFCSAGPAVFLVSTAFCTSDFPECRFGENAAINAESVANFF